MATYYVSRFNQSSLVFSQSNFYIIEFLGANEWDNRPFIVMPYLKNGNARDFIQARPGCNRLRIVRINVTTHHHMQLVSDGLDPDSSRLLGTVVSSHAEDCAR